MDRKTKNRSKERYLVLCPCAVLEFTERDPISVFWDPSLFVFQAPRSGMFLYLNQFWYLGEGTQNPNVTNVTPKAGFRGCNIYDESFTPLTLFCYLVVYLHFGKFEQP